MKIHRFGLVWTIIIAIVATCVSIVFYISERNLLLNTVADDVWRAMYFLEEEMKTSVEGGRVHEIQKIIDLKPLLIKSIDSVSLSKDGQTIFVSSSRPLKGKSIDSSYVSVKEIHTAIFNEHYKYSRKFTYQEDGIKKNGLILMHVQEQYLNAHLTKVAIFYISLVLFVVVLGSYTTFIFMRTLLIRPLEKVTNHARNAGVLAQKHFITELTELDNTLTVSFEKLKSKKNELQASLDETLYLSEIMTTVGDINHLLISSHTTEDLLRKSANRLARHSGYSSCWIALSENNKIVIQAISAESIGELSVGIELSDMSEVYEDTIAQAIILGKSIVVSQLSKQMHLYQWQTLSAHAVQGSFIALPLIANIDNQPIGVIGIYTNSNEGFTKKEITMLEELAGDIGFAVNAFKQRAELQHYLTTERITGLPNRVALIDRLSKNHNVLLAIINIDRFTDINDVYGTDIGDKVLLAYSRWLTGEVSTLTGMHIYKMSSDEFVVLLDDALMLEPFYAFIEHTINATAKHHFLVNDIEVLISITAGIAWPSNRILEHAVSAVKEAKATRKKIVVYEQITQISNHAGNVSWYKLIKSAIEESRFVPYFHPIVDNRTLEIIKYEALIRLVEKDGTVHSPMAFLSMAKKMRMYTQLTIMMVEKVCLIFKDQKIPVSINLSTEDIMNKELVEKIEDILLTNHMGGKVVFEIVESENIENYEETKLFIERFKSIGCRFSIDDFGSGYSNFEQFLKLNVDTIKIDGSLIRNIQNDHNAKLFVQNIAHLARELGMKTIAEYVSNDDIFRIVRDIGIDASQGYYFFEPMPNLQVMDASNFQLDNQKYLHG